MTNHNNCNFYLNTLPPRSSLAQSAGVVSFSLLFLIQSEFYNRFAHPCLDFSTEETFLLGSIFIKSYCPTYLAPKDRCFLFLHTQPLCHRYINYAMYVHLSTKFGSCIPPVKPK